MARLFSESGQPARPGPAKAAAPWSISQLAGRIKNALSVGLPGKVCVVGEVSNLSDRNHWFFGLKDEGATIRCVMFASSARRVSFPVRDGLEVLATGRVDFYDAQGNVQLYVEKLEPVGQGARELQLRELVAELRELGYFELHHKKPLPVLPRRVAVVTSRSAAALQDMIDTAGRRWRGCALLLYDVRVQGETAAPQVAAALRRLSRDGARLGIDAIVLTRGGGSIEDLWAFNERAVAEAVFDCALPIVAAIGHETDTSVAELVADVRCATPTQAAMTLIPDGQTLAQQLLQLERQLLRTAGRRLEASAHRLKTCTRHRLFRQPQRLVAEAEHRMDQLGHRLHASMPRRLGPAHEKLALAAARLAAAPPRRLELARQRLDALGRTLDAVSPQHVLQRGYTCTLAADGRPLRSMHEAKAGDKLITVLADGRIDSRVDGGARPAPPKPRRGKPRAPASDEPTLFG